MKRIAAITTAFAMLVPMSTSAFAQSADIQPSLAVLGDMCTVHESGEILRDDGQPIERSDLDLLLAEIEILDNLYGEFVAEEYKETLSNCVESIKQIRNASDDSKLTEEEMDTVITSLFVVLFSYGPVLEDTPGDELLDRAYGLAQQDYSEMPESDIRDYMAYLLAKDKSGMTEDEKKEHTMNLIAAASIYRSGATFVLGDVNRDGRINARDALMILRSQAGSSELEDYQTFLADVNKDNRLTAMDAVKIQRYAAGTISSFK